MPGQFARIALVTVILCIGGSAFAQTDPQSILRTMDDGIEACSSAKKASFARVQRNSFSVASANFDATYYFLDLFVGMDDDSISGTVRVEGSALNSALSTLTLDLASTMVVSSVIFNDVTPLAFTHPGAALNITLPSAQSPGTVFHVDITYRGVPATNGFGNFVFGTRSVDGNRYAWSLSEPYGAREWWPCKDHPSDKAESVRVRVTVPSAYVVGSQGTRVSQTIIGPNTRYDWVSNYPISSYLVSVAIGVYAQHNELYVRPGFLEADYGPLSLPLFHLRYNDGTPDLPSGWLATGDVMEVEESWFGPYPFANEKYGHSEFTFAGGMEHQTMTSIGSGSVTVVAHELAHQWYGDSISPKRWAHLWLNEGFATYAELIYFRERESTYPGTYDAVFESRYRSAKNATGTLVLADTTSVNDMFDGTRVYAKGSMVLYMLHHMVGDAVFKDIMKAYAADPAVQYGNAVTADFQRIAEAESGLDLDTFFHQWVTHGTGYPTYTIQSSWTQITGGYRVSVRLVQTQTSPRSNIGAFVMPMEIAVIGQTPADSTLEVHREVVQSNLRSQNFTFDVSMPPGYSISFIRIDPDRRILRSEYVDPIAQQPSIPIITSVRPNPTHGALQIEYQLDTDSTLDVNIYDVAGRRVSRQSIPGLAGGGLADIDTSRLASGVYFLRMSTPKGNAKTKFVLVR